MSDAATGEGKPGIERAYVSAEAGIAVAVDGATTVPDQVYVEFTAPVVVDGADGDAVPADGFALDGTLAGIETVQQGAVAGDPEGPGSRVLVLSLSMGITADEQPTLTYRPDAGDVMAPSGEQPGTVSDLDVTPGSPRVLDVSVLAERGDAVRVSFDRPVITRTEDATMFSLTDGGGNSLLDGDIAVDGSRVTLPLTRDVTEALSDGSQFTLAYREGGSDTERMHNLASGEGALVQRFSQSIDFEVESGFDIIEASVPRTPNGSGVIDRTRLELWFAPPVAAESAAGYELQNSLATVTGLASHDGDAPNAPDVALDLDAPIDPTDESDAAIHYDPTRGDTVAAGNETPDEPLSTGVEAIGAPPEPREARLSADGESITVEFDRSVRSQHADATGFKLSGTGDIGLSGSVEEGERLTLGLTDSLDFEETSNTVKLTYTTQGNNGPQYNLLGADDGMPVQKFSLAVDRADDTPAVERVRIPQESRDRVVVRFDRPVSAESAEGFSLSGSVARVEELAKVEGMDDDLVPYTVVLGLHVDVSTEEVTLTYDADAGTVTGEGGGSLDSFEADVQMLPPAPTVERAAVPAGESSIRLAYDRAITLNTDDATGFDLDYEEDRDGLASLTGTARADGGTVVLETDDPVALTAGPTLSYEPDDEQPNVLGTEAGVAADKTTVEVEQAEGGSDGSGGEEPVPTLVDATIPDDAPDTVVCTFDTAVDPEPGEFSLDGADLRVEGVADTGSETEWTLELSGEVPPGTTLKVIYDPAA